MKMSMNNGEWGCDLYFDDPDFPRNLHVWLESLDDTNLVVSSLAMFLAEHNVAGRAVLLSEGLGLLLAGGTDRQSVQRTYERTWNAV